MNDATRGHLYAEIKTSTNEDLKPCPTPWCDGIFGPPVLKEEQFSGYVYCPACGVESTRHGTTAAIIAAWNERPQPAAVKALVEARKKLFESINENRGAVITGDQPFVMPIGVESFVCNYRRGV